jgi:hypothetical protein
MKSRALLRRWQGKPPVNTAIAESRKQIPDNSEPWLPGGVTCVADALWISDRIKETLEEGTTGDIVDRVDIVPSNVYGLITKLLRVTQSPEATARFFAYPQTQQLLTRPEIMALFADPAIAGAASEGNYFSLLTSPKLAEVASDASVQEAFKTFDLEKALDYALQESAPSPAPTP